MEIKESYKIMDKITSSKKNEMFKQIVVVDGQAGCGKTLLSPIISSFKRVELLTYIFEIEFILRLKKMKKIKKDAAISMIKLFTDHKLYQTMMGREVNFRISDISSIYNYRNPNVYLNRIKQRGDEIIPNKINKKKPILNFTTHDLTEYINELFEAYGTKLVFIEVIRHPLYMIIQQSLNMKNLINTSRDVDVYYKLKNKEYPHFALGWESVYNKLNFVEKAIHLMSINIKKNEEKRKKILKSKFKNNYLLLPFEDFVKRPDKYLNDIKKKLHTTESLDTLKFLRKANVPRKKIADGIPLEIYKRCGWKPSKKNLNEKDELELRKKYLLKNNVSKKYIDIINSLSNKYEKKYYK